MESFEDLPVTRLWWGRLLCVPAACGLISVALPWFQPTYVYNGRELDGGRQYVGLHAGVYLGAAAFALLLFGLWLPSGIPTRADAARHRFRYLGGVTIVLGLWIGGSAIVGWQNVDPSHQGDISESARIADHGALPGFYVAAVAAGLTIALGLAILTYRGRSTRAESVARVAPPPDQ